MSEEKALERLVREARADLRPEGRGEGDDWSKVDEKLFARIAQEPSAAARLDDERRSRSWWIVGAFAAAAAAAVFLRPVSHGASFDATSSAPVAATHVVSSLVSRTGAGEVRVAGATTKDGSPLGAGDTVETEGARAFFVSAWGSGRTVAWSLEEQSSIDMRRVPRGQGTDGPLVLGLERGAIEAQVTPVPRGEAFAVDVGSMRVAVHGTHLRVAREGAHVSVDLTEGVVSIGEPPRTGSTYGTLVTAPAHVTFDLDDPSHEVHVDKSASAVRPAIQLTASPSGPSAARAVPAAAPPAAPERVTPPPPARAEHEGPGAVAAPPRSDTASVHADPHADATVQQAVASCTAPLLRGADVHVTVTSTLSLRVGPDGLVTFARFDPPLAPEAQTCAASVIYRTRFSTPGSLAIPIHVEE